MQSKWEPRKYLPGIFAAGAICLLLVGLGGRHLLREEPLPLPAEPPAAEAAAPITVPQPQVQPEPPVTEVLPLPAPEPVPEPEPQTPVSVPEFIPDDTPVIATPPSVAVTPLEGTVVTAFSVDRLLYSETLGDWRTHDGVDIAAAEGDSVLAAHAGTVVCVEDDPLMGTTVVIDDSDGLRTTYASLCPGPDVEEGDRVAAGQPIGAVGQTAAAEASQGPHLHFSVTRDGVPVDPAEFLH